MGELNTEVRKKSRYVRKRKAPLRVMVSFIIILVMIACGLFSYQYVIKSISEKEKDIKIDIPPESAITIEIPLGSSTDAIAGILKKNGVIKYPALFKAMSKLNGYDGTYKSGTHLVSKDLDYDKLMRVLTSNPVSIKVTIPEGLTYKQAVELLASKKLIDKSKFAKACNEEKFDYPFLQGISQRENRLEGYLFPDTYEFDMKAGDKEIIKRMLGNFNDKFKPEYYQKAKNLKMTVDQVIILASIIEREAKTAEDRRTIAGVFYNRLNSKNPSLKKLQSCATIQYIYLNREGKVKEKLTENDTKIHDPYNTYEIEGLPPGPICSPGLDSIEAALNPQKTDYLFFAARGDGTHQFSKTLKDHQAAIKKYGLN